MKAQAADLAALEAAILTVVKHVKKTRLLIKWLREVGISCEIDGPLDLDEYDLDLTCGRSFVMRMKFKKHHFYFSINPSGCKMCVVNDPPFKFIALDSFDGAPMDVRDPLQHDGDWKELIDDLIATVSPIAEKPIPPTRDNFLTRFLNR